VKQLRDTVWQRRGLSWIWDSEALAQCCDVGEVWSLRRALRAAGHWPENLPSNSGNTLVVAGLEGCLDLLSPGDAESWVAADVKGAISSFQDAYDGQAALVFWLPGGADRIIVSGTDAVIWRCSPPYASSRVDFGRILWGEAREYPQEIVLRDGARAAGLFHLRIT
jgi:hypothetical protein